MEARRTGPRLSQREEAVRLRAMHCRSGQCASGRSVLGDEAAAPVGHGNDKAESSQASLAAQDSGRQCESRYCAWPGCACPGKFRAPISRDHLREYIWLCLDHVRDYNRQWDYFAGMSVSEIDAHRRADTTWHRPSWAFGAWSAAVQGGMEDPFGFFGSAGAEGASAGTGEQERRGRFGGRIGEMVAILGLDIGFTLEELKHAYKSLAKRYHPDLNGGDRDAEEALKRVIEAYTYLRDNRIYA